MAGIVEPRGRSLPETLALAGEAAKRAGVTRVSDVTAFAVPGIPVFQATRPCALSLTVSQGKGLTPSAAIVGALLEATELWSAESIARPDDVRPLAALAARERASWAGPRDELAIALDPTTARAWLAGEDLLSGRACAMPWDLLSLDYTRDGLECPATSMGLACGNSRVEALASGLAEVLEHHATVRFERLNPREKLARQIVLATIDDPAIRRLLQLVEGAGFVVKAWSMADDAGLAAIRCGLIRRELCLDDLAPVAGSGCHPSAPVAFARALLEAVQSQAGLVAGARDDLDPADYGSGAQRAAAVYFGALAFGDGELDWRAVPTADCPTSEDCLEFLLGKAEELGGLPVMAYHHAPPVPGLHLAHVIAPGLLHEARRGYRPPAAAPDRVDAVARAGIARGAGAVLFAGPSVSGLAIPPGIALRPPARCGDLAALLDDPPAAVGLVDGYFRLAPTVWHKEILALLAAGTRVIGGASLGALRAAELDLFGMEGVGEIYRWYRNGLLVRDDAVMLVHAPAELGYAPLSVALVDAEHTLWNAALPPRALRTMQRIVRSTPFDARTWPECVAEYRRRTGEDFMIPAEALAAAPSLKQADARLAIETLVEAGAGERSERRPMPPLTSHFRGLLARTGRPAPPARP